jgi:cytochrome c
MSSRWLRLAAAAAAAAGLGAAAGPALAGGDPVRGATVYERCEGCHSLDANRVGPMHRGVFGRTAGTVPDYAYSQALKDSGLIWDEETLDVWLQGPRAFVPGVRMTFQLTDPQDRADVIAYLKKESGK